MIEEEQRFDEASALPAKSGRSNQAISWRLLTQISEGLAYGMRVISDAAEPVAVEHCLGQRGTWILSLINNGVCFPGDLAIVLKIRPSLMTSEIGHLTEAGLVVVEPHPHDRRRSQLVLTPAGHAAHERVKSELTRTINHNLAGYSMDQIELFVRMLTDISRSQREGKIVRKGNIPKKTGAKRSR